MRANEFTPARRGSSEDCSGNRIFRGQRSYSTSPQEDDARMSHIVTIQTRVHDPHAVAAACRRLNLAAPVQGTAKLYSGEAEGLVVEFPGWKYPAVVDPLTGTVRYDNFSGVGPRLPATGPAGWPRPFLTPSDANSPKGCNDPSPPPLLIPCGFQVRRLLR